MFLFPLFYVIREFHRFLHRGKAGNHASLCYVFFFQALLVGGKNDEKAVPRSPLLLGNLANFLAKRVALWSNLKPLLLLLFAVLITEKET